MSGGQIVVSLIAITVAIFLFDWVRESAREMFGDQSLSNGSDGDSLALGDDFKPFHDAPNSGEAQQHHA